MSDISKCPGNGCPVKEKCYRYTAKAGVWQTWFSKEPFKISKKGVFKCDMFWGLDAERLYNQIVDIVNGFGDSKEFNKRSKKKK